MPTYIQIIIRLTITYLFLLLITRLMGKREVSQLSYFDYVIGITIGSMAANVTIDTTNPISYIFIVLSLFGLFQIITAYISLKSTSFRKITAGSKRMLIENGRILEKNMKKERLNIDELASKLREKNVFNLADVEFAFLEVDGKISVQKKPNVQPLTPSDLKLSTTYNGVGEFIVREGILQEDILREYGLTRSWLMSKLGEKDIFDVSKVMFAQVDANGTLYVDLYDIYNKNSQKNTANEILLAKLNKVHSDLLTYYTETNNKTAKDLYKNCADNIEHVTQYFHNYLRDQSNKNEIFNSPKA